MRPKIVFGSEEFIIFDVLFALQFRQQGKERPPWQAGEAQGQGQQLELEVASLHFFLEEISSFFFLRLSKRRRYTGEEM